MHFRRENSNSDFLLKSFKIIEFYVIFTSFKKVCRAVVLWNWKLFISNRNFDLGVGGSSRRPTGKS